MLELWQTSTTSQKNKKAFPPTPEADNPNTTTPRTQNPTTLFLQTEPKAPDPHEANLEALSCGFIGFRV